MLIKSMFWNTILNSIIFIIELDPQACELFVQMKITKDGSSYPASDQVILNEYLL